MLYLWVILSYFQFMVNRPWDYNFIFKTFILTAHEVTGAGVVCMKPWRCDVFDSIRKELTARHPPIKYH